MKITLRNLPLIGPIFRRRADPAWRVTSALPQRQGLVVQVGSNDGIGDPVYKLLQQRPEWRAILVEPVPYVFDLLKKTYGDDPRIRFENVAINAGEPLPFYWVDAQAAVDLPHLPAHWNQLGSFMKDHITKHLLELKPYVRETMVTGLTLTGLLEKNGVGNFDFLHIDTEGYDWKILKQLDLKRWKPRVILFEHKHLSREEMAEARAFLRPFYQIVKLRSDTFCRLK